MSMSPWKGGSVNGRCVRVDGSAAQNVRSGVVAESQDPGLIQLPAYGRPVAWRGWSAPRQEPVAPTAWTGWSIGQESSAAPVHPTPQDKNPGNLLKPALLEGAVAPKASAPAVDVSLPEAAAFAGRGCALGIRAEAGDIVPPPQRARKPLAEAAARARAGRKFLRGGLKGAMTWAKIKRESFGEDEILAEELAEAGDKFPLFLTNKDFQNSLGHVCLF